MSLLFGFNGLNIFIYKYIGILNKNITSDQNESKPRFYYKVVYDKLNLDKEKDTCATKIFNRVWNFCCVLYNSSIFIFSYQGAFSSAEGAISQNASYNVCYVYIYNPS